MTAIIQTQNTVTGKYKTITKTFNNEQHMNNYMSILIKNNTKIIGTHIVSEA